MPNDLVASALKLVFGCLPGLPSCVSDNRGFFHGSCRNIEEVVELFGALNDAGIRLGFGLRFFIGSILGYRIGSYREE